MGRPTFLRSVLFACAALLVSGCADILYTPTNTALNDPDTSGCDQQTMGDNLVKSCRRLGEGSPVTSAAPFFDVVRHTTVADPYKLSQKPSLAAQFFFELTPLGVLAPIFDYPPKETVYTGSVELSISPPEAAARVASKFDFHVKAGDMYTKTLEFNKSSGKESASDDVRYSPDSVTVSIRCRSRGCTLSSKSPVVGSDGVIKLQRSSVTDIR